MMVGRSLLALSLLVSFVCAVDEHVQRCSGCEVEEDPQDPKWKAVEQQLVVELNRRHSESYPAVPYTVHAVTRITSQTEIDSKRLVKLNFEARPKYYGMAGFEWALVCTAQVEQDTRSLSTGDPQLKCTTTPHAAGK